MKIHQSVGNKKKAKGMTRISENRTFRPTNTERDKAHFINLKSTIYNKDIIMTNRYAESKTATFINRKIEDRRSGQALLVKLLI